VGIKPDVEKARFGGRPSTTPRGAACRSASSAGSASCTKPVLLVASGTWPPSRSLNRKKPAGAAKLRPGQRRGRRPDAGIELVLAGGRRLRIAKGRRRGDVALGADGAGRAGMLSFPRPSRLYLCTVACDMRRSFDGLSMMAEHIIRCNPFSGHLLVFCNKRSDRLKILYWDRRVGDLVQSGWRRGRSSFHSPRRDGGRSRPGNWGCCWRDRSEQRAKKKTLHLAGGD